MNVLFYDKLWDSLIKLPKSTQSKFIDFQKKFRENPKSPGLHVEPLINVKDSSLRSARVDGTYRVIVKFPEKGNTYYLLWVDNHDEAYQWAKNKVFTWNENTQSMQVFSAPEETQSFKKEVNPNTDSGLYNSYSEKKLIRIGVPEILIPSIRKIKNLSDLEEIEQYLPSEVFENLFYLADGANIEHIIQEVDEGRIEKQEVDKQVLSLNNQRSFIQLTDDKVFNEMLSGNLQKWKYYLHPSQQKLVRGNYSGSVKVSGAAGTGKTVAAIHRLKYLTQIAESNERILFTTFTKALTQNLSSLINDFDIDTGKVLLRNIDNLVFSLGKEYNVINENTKVIGFNAVKTEVELWEESLLNKLVPFDIEFLIAEYRMVALYNNVQTIDDYIKTSRTGRGKPISRRQRKELWQVFEHFDKLKMELNYVHKEDVYNKVANFLINQSIPPFDYVIVDELQDLSNIELRLIRALVPEKMNDLFMVGDPMQRIYDRKINFSKVNINIRGRKSHRLRINYRTTEEIKKLAYSVIQDDKFDDFNGEEENKAGYISLFHGGKPTYQVFKSGNEELKSVVNEINSIIQSNYHYYDIAISSRTKNSLKDFRKLLHEHEIPFADYSDGKLIGNKDGVRILTFHNMKGLEFKHVFLVDVNYLTVPWLPKNFELLSSNAQANHLKHEKSLIYVAISRAKENVKITGIGKAAEIISI